MISNSNHAICFIKILQILFLPNLSLTNHQKKTNFLIFRLPMPRNRLTFQLQTRTVHFLKLIELPYPYSVMQIKAHDANGHAHGPTRIHVSCTFAFSFPGTTCWAEFSLAISQPALHGRTRLQLTRPIKVDLHQRQPARKECLAIQFNGPVCTYPSYAPAALTSHPSCSPYS